MAQEIERKYLVTRTDFLEGLPSSRIQQGYFSASDMKLFIQVGEGRASLVLQSTAAANLGRAPRYAFDIPMASAVALGAGGHGLAESQIELSLDPAQEGSVTARIRLVDARAYVTIKGKKVGISCLEEEFLIEPAVGCLLYYAHACPGRIEKQRYLVPVAGEIFEVDVFSGALEGLVIAELELPHEEHAVPRPSWLGAEVTHDPRYRNSELAVSLTVPG